LQTCAAYREQIDKLAHKAASGGQFRGPRRFPLLTTQDSLRIHSYFDYLFPKHYFWHRGFDGKYGTIARWVRTLGQWNPALNEQECFAVVKCLFGLKLPGVESINDLEMGFPDEFFSEVVYSETRRVLDAVEDDSKVIAWVLDPAAIPHAGRSDARSRSPADSGRFVACRAQTVHLPSRPQPGGRRVERDLSVCAANAGRKTRMATGPPDTPKPDTWKRRPQAEKMKTNAHDGTLTTNPFDET
jgi:hypothetical protein